MDDTVMKNIFGVCLYVAGIITYISGFFSLHETVFGYSSTDMQFGLVMIALAFIILRMK